MIPIDKYQADDMLVARLELAGVDPEADVELSITTPGCTRKDGVLDIRIPTAAVEAPEKIPIVKT
jgi:HSP20 family molecular chaperone IbpA